MDNDQRDRRDWPDSDASQSADEPSWAAEEPGASSDEPEWTASQPNVAPEQSEWSTEAREPAPAEVESWPARDAADERAGAAERDEPSWPTDPPAAGSGDDDTWPTSAPERDASPPSEVEAYPADTGRPADTAATAAHAVPQSEESTGESTQCPRCGTENRPGLAFCRQCGQRLVAAGVSTTVERPGTPDGTTACPRCGTHNRAGVAFCQNCGANLRGTGPGYVPPAAVAEDGDQAEVDERRGAVLGPVVLLIGAVGLITGYLLPFLYGTGSLFDRAYGADGYGIAFWNGYPEVGAELADQVYFGLAGPVPLLALLVVALAIGGFVRARPGALQVIGLVIALLWSVGLIVLFVLIEVLGNWDGDIVGVMRVLSPAGIIFFLSSLIVLIGTLTRFGRS